MGTSHRLPGKDPLWAVSAETLWTKMSKDGSPIFVLHADTYWGSTEVSCGGHGPKSKVDPPSELKEIISDA